MGASPYQMQSDGLSTWRFPLARPGVQAPGDGVELRLRVVREIGAFRKVLAE